MLGHLRFIQLIRILWFCCRTGCTVIFTLFWTARSHLILLQIPRMNVYPGNHSILVLDNCRIHHNLAIVDLVNAAGMTDQPSMFGPWSSWCNVFFFIYHPTPLIWTPLKSPSAPVWLFNFHSNALHTYCGCVQWKHSYDAMAMKSMIMIIQKVLYWRHAAVWQGKWKRHGLLMPVTCGMDNSDSRVAVTYWMYVIEGHQ